MTKITQPPLESAVVSRILKFLNSQEGCKAIKTHGSGYFEAGTPDILGSFHGRFLAIEVKRPGGTYGVTKLQQKRLAEWKSTGAIVGVATSVEDVRNLLTESVERW